MNQTQNKLLEYVGKVLFGSQACFINNDEVNEEAQKQAVSGLIDPNAYPVFAGNVRIIKAHKDLCALLEGIPFVIIKGCASAYYYPQPQKRTMGDVDFYVESGSFDEAEKRLLDAGFVFDHATPKHRCFRKAGISYEMHCTMNGMPDDNAEVRKWLEDLIPTSRKVDFTGDMICIPDDFHNGLICLLHFYRHLSLSEIGLRHLCDWACLVNRVTDFESVFKEKFEKAGLWTCARILSLTAVKYLGLPYQTWMGKADEAAVDLLIEEIMSSGNMGRKQNDYETAWFVDREGTGSGIKGIISSLNCSIRQEWPISEKFPALYPFGWVFFSVRYLLRMLSGKRRRTDFVEITRKAREKSRLLQSLQMFRT